MAPDGQIFGANRLVVYLPVAVGTLSELDGARERRIRKKIEQFLSSPEGSFEKHPREYLSQVKDRNSKMRAFATWCQNPKLNSELSVVHQIYRKKNESAYWEDIAGLNEEGEKFARMFQNLTDERFQKWQSKVRETRDMILVTD